MICNATPLIFLAKINKLKFLRDLFNTVTIPENVKKEVLKETKSGYVQIKNALEEGWIKVEDPKDNQDLQLGEGENSAINLARERREALIIDDALAIKVAQEFDIETLRTTTIIFKVINKRIINKEEGIELLNKLIENDYYISNEHYARILTRLKS